jgi:hypothetical protein
MRILPSTALAYSYLQFENGVTVNRMLQLMQRQRAHCCYTLHSLLLTLPIYVHNELEHYDSKLPTLL